MNITNTATAATNIVNINKLIKINIIMIINLYCLSLNPLIKITVYLAFCFSYYRILTAFHYICNKS